MSINSDAKKQYEASRQNVAGRQAPAAPARGGRGKTLGRLIRTLFTFYPKLLPIVVVCIVVQAILSAMPATFIQRALEIVTATWESGDWASVSGSITTLTLTLICVYAVTLAANFTQTRLMAIITQGSLEKFREMLFDHMQDLPISYFDQHQRGDIMSYYTNDIDTLRQMISQSMPNICLTVITCCSVICVMVYYSVWMALVVILGVCFMAYMTKQLGGRSARNFVAQQHEISVVEGHVEEIMNGQRVVKVFCHEDAAQEDFDVRNEKLFRAARAANMYTNTLGPILMNLGNLMYVIVALAGGIFIAFGTPNVSVSGLAFSVAVTVPFLNMTKQFAGQIGQISQQINAVVMGLAGAERIFELMDEEPEHDEGYVTLVNTKMENGQLVEVETGKHTGRWAWKHPHHDGTVELVPLEGDVRLSHVDFGYKPGHTVLHDVSVWAKPGQKIAFVGATGAGKTTITNLINRFYDIADGKIRYDGININKIKKNDLRRSLGMVLQDVNLFTGTVMDNIRYGRLDATDEECIAAAKLAGAHGFIERLPEGYNTMLTDNGSNLSQGQRQLLSISRAAVADPPVMILDEATSSIDTRTEAIVQRGMDALMNGRTTFVIAHRLSTVRNSDAIIVLDHGRIIERGSHDELIAKRGTYYQLYTGAFELE
ncbi:ABC transporter ATP-binding protein [Collinsella tanakaei]|uniref:Fatty acid ABC transporter ATP-binding/permease protein n=1 Tax=Collinsella ihumii TaxID=1720204 RepID=A0AAW7JT82_9ACTN|nr:MULTISPECIES: ABC transporter ATP-binding protein [Collinsella]MBM6687703.1 ABC transporter ATP-binding protein [Collinsella tanakaei]MBM6777580.1 ABC transporter ATP-binding protein [Collinsella tanakaei]MBM6786282.1 ABC transporter ATP-binding protein [Collinsella tanakaei]MBM6904676.1 ABC transporter ATP-binding protein [Collinsella tanakaei]MCF6412478.1 ABC transporter ATP-binding protein [Collinsella tanakaei]